MKTGSVLLYFEEDWEFQTYGSKLCKLGYKIHLCDSVAEGIHTLDTEDVSMVIVSQGTSAFEGRHLLEKSRRLYPDVPVLVIARVLDMECYLESMDLGAVDYLERPDPQDMARAVETQVRRSEAA